MSEHSDFVNLSRESKVFAYRVARSIEEVQLSINNLADVVVFLEILGYNDRLVQKYGFANLHNLAHYIYDFIDLYESDSDQKTGKNFVEEIPSTGKRIIEGLSHVFPWIGAFIVLAISGVSLWMATGLPEAITTSFLGGVFLGIILSEGPVQSFTRLFTFYHYQGNTSETGRIIKRSYLSIISILLTASAALLLLSYFSIPQEIIAISIFSMATIAIHRTSFVIIFSLRKNLQIVLSYLAAFIIIVASFYALGSFLEDVTTRYIYSLTIAFSALSVPAIYYHFKSLTHRSQKDLSGKAIPHFYNPSVVNSSTIKSRYSIQLWETLPFALFGVMYFIMIFGDRILSWFFNPDLQTSGSQISWMLFNPAYHIGADLALLVVLPAIILQYVLVSPIYLLINNRSVELKVFEAKHLNRFIQDIYKKVLIYSIIVSAITAVLLNIVGNDLIVLIGGVETSITVLRYATIANIFMTLFGANALFMMFIGRTKKLLTISAISLSMLVLVGIIFGQQNHTDIVFGYLLASVIAAILSTVLILKHLGNAGDLLFAKYI